MADPIESALKKGSKQLRWLAEMPEHLPAHISPAGAHTHPVTTKPPAETTFAESYDTAFDTGIEMKDRFVDVASKGLKEMGHHEHIPFVPDLAADWLHSTVYFKPRQGRRSPVPPHEERYGQTNQ